MDGEIQSTIDHKTAGHMGGHNTEGSLTSRKVLDAIDDYLRDEPEPGTFSHTRWKVAKFMEQGNIKWAFISVVILNAILLGVQADHGQDGEQAWEVLEVIFVTIFMVEIVLKLFGLGVLLFSDPWNVFDFLIVVVSTVEVALPNASDSTTTSLIPKYAR